MNYINNNSLLNLLIFLFFILSIILVLLVSYKNKKQKDNKKLLNEIIKIKMLSDKDNSKIKSTPIDKLYKTS